jgi:hypothetical protein
MSTNLPIEEMRALQNWKEWICRDRPVAMSTAQAFAEVLAIGLAAERAAGRPPGKAVKKT